MSLQEPVLLQIKLELFSGAGKGCANVGFAEAVLFCDLGYGIQKVVAAQKQITVTPRKAFQKAIDIPAELLP